MKFKFELSKQESNPQQGITVLHLGNQFGNLHIQINLIY